MAATVSTVIRRQVWQAVQPAVGPKERSIAQTPFVRCHREFVVNLNRVRALTARSDRDDDLRLDPPVNRRIPIARDRLQKVRQTLGV